jgi:Transcriptional regulator, AbiEi antitoxin
VAAKQHGVVSVRQLRDLGFTARQVEWLTEHGHLHRLYRGVYAVGHLKLTRDGRLAAALLAAGDGAFLSHRTAAALQRLRNLNLRRIDVTVAGAAVRPRQGIRIHRTSETPVRGEVTELNGLRVSTVPRLLVELAATETQDELGRLIDEAVRKRAFDHANLRTAIDRHDKRPGIGKLRAAYAAYVPRPDRKSDLERAFDRLLAKHPEIPEPLRNVYLGIWELDQYWPDHHVALELDGRPYHLVVHDIERDRRKDAYLLTHGIRPLRVTDARFEADPMGSLDDLKKLLQLG